MCILRAPEQERLQQQHGIATTTTTTNNKQQTTNNKQQIANSKQQTANNDNDNDNDNHNHNHNDNNNNHNHNNNNHNHNHKNNQHDDDDDDDDDEKQQQQQQQLQPQWICVIYDNDKTHNAIYKILQEAWSKQRTWTHNQTRCVDNNKKHAQPVLKGGGIEPQASAVDFICKITTQPLKSNMVICYKIDRPMYIVSTRNYHSSREASFPIQSNCM